jgi:hypothetical protein
MINSLIIRMRRIDMIRKVTLAALMTAAIALPVMAQETPKIDPSNKGPTDTMSKEVPTMKGNSAMPAPNASPSATTGATATPGATPDKSMSTATPAMKPGDPVSGSADATIKSGSIILSQQDEKVWIGKPVYSNDQKKIGEVESFRRGPSGEVIGLNAGIGGFLGLGETHVMLTSSQFKLQGDRVVADVPSAEAKNLPKAK